MKTWIAIGALLTFLASLPASGQAGYQGIWLNTDAYTQDVTQLKLHVEARQIPVVYVMRGNPLRQRRWEIYDAAIHPRPDRDVPVLFIRPHQAEAFWFQRQPDGRLRVIRHTDFPVQTDTLWFSCYDPLRRKYRVSPLAEVPTGNEFLLTFTPAVTRQPSLLFFTHNP
ncbi:MAG: hypothetical protein LH606_03785 [Cytophagaceae bacterium]|nr:hypothetical protein [Cytophagaceae bacterium]